MNNKPEEQHIWEAYRSYDGFASDKDSPTTLDRDHGGKGTQIGKGHSSVRGEGKTKNTMKYDHRSKKFFKPVDRNKGCKDVNRKPAAEKKELEEETDDRRTKQGDHAPGPEGSSPGSYHSRPDSRKGKRAAKKKDSASARHMQSTNPSRLKDDS